MAPKAKHYEYFFSLQSTGTLSRLSQSSLMYYVKLPSAQINQYAKNDNPLLTYKYIKTEQTIPIIACIPQRFESSAI